MKEMLRKEDTALSQRLGNLTCVVMTATLRELGNGSHLPSFRSSIFKPYESFLATFHSLFPNSISSPTITIATHILWQAWGIIRSARREGLALNLALND